uniref:Secreted protein n=1 Tax=Macrostomum lignano TaxID=282301 RepID=A0A1I8FK05_9PLAT
SVYPAAAHCDSYRFRVCCAVRLSRSSKLTSAAEAGKPLAEAAYSTHRLARPLLGNKISPSDGAGLINSGRIGGPTSVLANVRDNTSSAIRASVVPSCAPFDPAWRLELRLLPIPSCTHEFPNAVAPFEGGGNTGAGGKRIRDVHATRYSHRGHSGLLRRRLRRTTSGCRRLRSRMASPRRVLTRKASGPAASDYAQQIRRATDCRLLPRIRRRLSRRSVGNGSKRGHVQRRVIGALETDWSAKRRGQASDLVVKLGGPVLSDRRRWRRRQLSRVQTARHGAAADELELQRAVQAWRTRRWCRQNSTGWMRACAELGRMQPR